MSKSVFLLNSDMRRMKPQLRRVHEALGGSALKLEGPFEDRYDAVSKLSEEVRYGQKNGSIGDPVIAAMYALSPQNMAQLPGSWLKTPFTLGENPEDLDLYSAGAIASCETIDADGRTLRVVDSEALTFLAVAVLRRLGVPALFAYQHIDPEQPLIAREVEKARKDGMAIMFKPIPSVITMGDRHELIAFGPPAKYQFPGGGFIKGIEVMGDDAVSAIMTIKTAHGRMKSLIWDVATGAPHFQGEWTGRAMGLGHTLHDGISGWSVHEAEQGLREAESILNQGESGLESARRISETEMVEPIVCPMHRTIFASDAMLDKRRRDIVRQLASTITKKEFAYLGLLIEQLSRRVPNDVAFARFTEYLKLGELMAEHVHPAEICPDLGPSAGN